MPSPQRPTISTLQESKEEKACVCRLNKAIYGLKQAKKRRLIQASMPPP